MRVRTQDFSGRTRPRPQRLARHLAALPDRPDRDALADAAGGPAQKDAADDIDWLVSVD
ncbi:hypothetical protein [Streptomyces sp. NPDC002825]|uniref:hypothetical protein n=1 Tax=Streptomyces sp. NPDC002825 TaxID=3154666 RepID=UPI00332BCDA0